MKRLKKFFNRLIFPPFWLILFFGTVSAAGLFAVFYHGLDSHPIAYAIFAFSFYSLSVIVIYISLKAPKQLKRLKSELMGTKYGNKYFTDVNFKTSLSLYTSFFINLGNIVISIVSGILYDTNWFFVLSFYYAILSVIRFMLAAHKHKHEMGTDIFGEWKRYRICGCVLTLVNLSLTGTVLMMMYQGKGFTYAGMLIYVMAFYAFYNVTDSIVSLVKYKKYHSPVINAIRIVSLTTSLVSMLSLETAMLTAFGAETSPEDKRIMIAATGAGIAAVVLAFSSYMIIKSTKEINKLKETNND